MKTIIRTMFLGAALTVVAGCGANVKKNKQEVAAVEVAPKVTVAKVSVREVKNNSNRNRKRALVCLKK